MSMSVLVIGESGTGKSTSLRNLNQDETFLIAAVDKPLPFRNRYKKLIKDDTGKLVGNQLVTDDYRTIKSYFQAINDKRPEIKNVIVDDFQYIMANEFMRRADEKGFGKFTELAQHTWEIIQATQHCREDLTFFFLTHSDSDGNGKYKAKTIGKLLDEKITIEGLFTIVFHSLANEERYAFLTQNDGQHIAKSPMEMFEDKYIPNDLQYVKEKIDHYYNVDVQQ